MMRGAACITSIAHSKKCTCDTRAVSAAVSAFLETGQLLLHTCIHHPSPATNSFHQTSLLSDKTFVTAAQQPWTQLTPH
jgi:hypothetical protein